jgi:hypothetical protein
MAVIQACKSTLYSGIGLKQARGEFYFPLWGYPVYSRTHYMLFFINDSMNGYLIKLRSQPKRFIPSPLMGEG